MYNDPAAWDRINSFALVSYIPEPLAGFLDRLRQELVPNCFLRAHVTILPPRPISSSPEAAWETVRTLAPRFAPFEVEMTATGGVSGVGRDLHRHRPRPRRAGADACGAERGRSEIRRTVSLSSAHHAGAGSEGRRSGRTGPGGPCALGRITLPKTLPRGAKCSSSRTRAARNGWTWAKARWGIRSRGWWGNWWTC